MDLREKEFLGKIPLVGFPPWPGAQFCRMYFWPGMEGYQGIR
jgi:hypothetical protein